MTWVRAASVSEIASGECKTVNVQGKALALYNVNGTFACTDNTCLHRGGPLGEGMLDGGVVTCPWHGWQYNVKSGACYVNNALTLKTYPTKTEGNDVMVEL